MRISDWSSDVCSSDLAYVSPSSRHFTDLAGRRLGKPQSLTPFPFFFPLNPPSGSASRRQPFDLAGEVTQLTMRFLQVVVGLQTQPEALAGTQRQRHADGGVRGDPTLAEDDFVDPARRDVHRARQRVLADAERAEELLQQDFTGLDRSEERRGGEECGSTGKARWWS